MRAKARGVLAALPLALVLALAGCGSDGGGDGDSGDKDGVASADKSSKAGAGKGAGKGDGKPGDGYENSLKFAQCMRKNGVDMDDPKPGKAVTLRIGKGISKATVDKAMESCRKYDPMQQGQGRPDPKGQEAARKEAKCMRENGVEDFPDPKDGGIRLDGKVFEDPDFKAAEKKCSKRRAGGGGGLTSKGGDA
jgi:hypothetical protein